MQLRRFFVVSFDVNFVDKAYVKAYDKVGLQVDARFKSLPGIRYMEPHGFLFWTVLIAIALMIGVSKGGLPGIGILAIIWLPMVMPARASTGMILPLLIAGDLFAVWSVGRHAVWRHLWKVLPCAVAGVLLGWLLLAHVNDRQLRPIIGGIILAMLALGAYRSHQTDAAEHIPEGWWFAVLMGLAGGIATMLANAAGPIMIIYLLAMRLPKTAFVGTTAWYFLLVNSFKVPFSMQLGLITADSLRINLLLLPVILAGNLLGLYLLQRIPEKAFHHATRIFAFLGALRLLCPA